MKKEFSFLNNTGLSLFEIIIALIISAPLLAASIKILNNSNHNKKSLVKAYNFDYNYIIFDNYLQQTVGALDQHRFIIYPIVYKKAKINFTITNNKQLEPNSNSDIISSLKFDMLNIQKVINIDKIKILMCSRFNEKFDPSKYKSFLGISQSGFYQLEILKIENNFNGCRSLYYKIIESRFFEYNNYESNLIKYLVPIKEEFLLYVDSKRTLRYISLLGKNVIENQPLIDNFAVINLNLNYLFENNIINIEGFLEYKNKKISFSHFNQLAREPFFNFFFNL